VDDSWLFDTRNTRASNSTLHSINTRAVKSGPFVQFEIPDDANMFVWYRLPTSTDSQKVLVCVDRGQVELLIESVCRELDIRALGNPIIIRESDPAFGGSWGDAWGDNDTHTVEIFSLINQTFSVDRIQVINTDTVLYPGEYDDLIFAQSDADAFARTGTFTRFNNTRASFGAFTETSTVDNRFFARFNGTGFAATFLQDSTGGTVDICVAPGLLADALAVEASSGKICRTYNNGGSTLFGVSRVFAGLNANPQNYSVSIRHTQATKRMKFDSFEVFGAATLPFLQPGADGSELYQTSYVNRATDGLFSYYGSTWRSVTGTAAKAYSGSNYDTITGKIGAGILFRVSGAAQVQILRQPGARNANLQVCVDPGVLPVNCQDVLSTADPAVVTLPNTGAHTVSVITTSSGLFNLDAINVYTGTAVMFPGVYEDNNALLNYSATQWTTATGSSYSEVRGKQTTLLDASVTFNINGNRVEVAAFVAALDQMEVCWATGLNATTFLPANCSTVGAAPLSARQIKLVDTLPSVADYTVRVRNLITNKKLVLDYVAVYDINDALTEGRYEQSHPTLVEGRVNDANWSTVTSSAYSGGSAARNTVLDSPLQFEFTGTGFEIAIPTGRFGSEVEICYETGSLPYDGSADRCYTYQHETSSTVYTVTRSVNGLARGTYSVQVRLLDENGSLFGPTRSTANAPALLVDYVSIFDDEFPLVQPGVYNDNARDSSGNRLLALSPANRWATISGTAAVKFSGGSYATVADDTARLSGRYAGPVASLNVSVPANSTLTVVLDTGIPSTRNPLELLACFRNVDSTTAGDPCRVITTMRTAQQQVYTVSNTTASPVQGVVSFRALTPGEFKIDGFQVLEGVSLAEGIYDDLLASVPSGTNPAPLIELTGTWQTGFRNAKAYGGTMIRTQTNGASFTFDFTGTGFGIMTQQFTGGIDFNITVDGVSYCTPEKGFTCTSDLTSGTLIQAGLVAYGLPFDEHTVVVTINDTTINTRTDWFYLDAVFIFGGLTDALEPGFYDQTALPSDSVAFGPQPNWTTTTTNSGPTSGAFGRSFFGAINSGSVAHMNVEGNGLILYQNVATTNSSDVRICLVIEGTLTNELQCSNFSQNGRTTWFAPIAFYGFGSGEHIIIFHNRNHGRRFNVDAVRVLE
jgi:hypothetical protein